MDALRVNKGNVGPISTLQVLICYHFLLLCIKVFAFIGPILIYFLAPRPLSSHLQKEGVSLQGSLPEIHSEAQ